MSDLRGSFEKAGYQESQEQQRLLGLLAQPNTVFRMSYDSFYETDPRLYPQEENAQAQPFDKILIEDWETLKASKPPEISDKDFEAEWLSPLSKEQIEEAIQASINSAQNTVDQEALQAYKERFLQRVDEYNQRLEQVQHAPEVTVQNTGLIIDPDEGESQLNYLNSASVKRDEAIRRRLQTGPQEPIGAIDITDDKSWQREDQADFEGSKGMKRQQETNRTSNLIVNTGIEPRIEQGQPQHITPKLDRKRGLYISPNYRPSNYKVPEPVIDFSVPQKAAKEFGYKEGAAQSEQRIFRVELAVNIRKPEFIFLPQEGKLKLFYTADEDKDGTVTPKRRNVYINLNPEEFLAYNQDPDSIQQAFLEILQTNEGEQNPKAFYNLHSGNLELGIGGSAHLNVIESLSPKDLREKLPHLAAEVNDYLALKHASKLKYEQKQELYKFQDALWAILEVKPNGQKLTLKQKIWDDAFSKYWKQKIGDEKHAEFLVQVLEDSKKQPELNDPIARNDKFRAERGKSEPVIRNPEQRWSLGPEYLQRPEYQKKRELFLRLSENFPSWEYILSHAKSLKELAEQAGLTVPETFYTLGEDVLAKGEERESQEQRIVREQLYAEYQRFLNMGRDNIRRELKGRVDLSEEGAKTKPRLLRNYLLNAVKENLRPAVGGPPPAEQSRDNARAGGALQRIYAAAERDRQQADYTNFDLEELTEAGII
jgi:hypothetical protein